MTASHSDQLKQLDELLATGNQSWLLGAGISLSAGLPLMGALTDRVLAIAKEESHQFEGLLRHVKSKLPSNATIEHILSHFADHLAIADRSKENEVVFDKIKITCNQLRDLIDKSLIWIASTIRWGYQPAGGTPEKIGKSSCPIVTVDGHQAFIDAIFNRAQAGVSERRGPIRFFTTNYDTLLEDALSLCCVPYWDGYSGGAVAFRSFKFGESEPPDGSRAHVIKLHGSIDWHMNDKFQIYRVRDNDLFPQRNGRVLIYPQATKYLATQRDPFAGQFDLFRRSLLARNENVLAICGYSCGDDHINQEIELALQKPDNKTTVIVFASSITPVLEEWRGKNWAERLYLVTENGIYIGKVGPFAAPSAGKKHRWWTFEGVTDLLSKGSEACAV